MERAMTADEKIRRAEEIYQRRRMNETRKTTARVNVADTPKDYRLFKRMVIQIMACLCIYFVFFLIKNGNYIFSEDFIKKAQEILSYDLNFGEQYKNIASFFESKSETEEQVNEIIPLVEEVEQPETEVETLSAVSEEAAVEELVEESSSVSQTLTDAGDILASYSLIKPLTGTITSRFRPKEPHYRNGA